MTTAFVLPGGATFASIQVGMLEALAERGVQPDLLFGASAGALNAAWLASQPGVVGVAGLRQLWLSVRRREIFPFNPLTLALGLAGRRDHTISNRAFAAWLEANVPFERLEDATIPLQVLATDAMTGEAVAMRRGPAVEALLASSALPGLFPPVAWAGRLLIDGAVAANTPVDLAVEAGADVVYVLPTIGPVNEAAVRNPPAVAQRAINFMLGRVSAETVKAAASRVDVYVLPAPSSELLSPFSFRHAAMLIDQARDEARRWLPTARPVSTEVVSRY